jgi:hypothetical protein
MSAGQGYNLDHKALPNHPVPGVRLLDIRIGTTMRATMFGPAENFVVTEGRGNHPLWDRREVRVVVNSALQKVNTAYD